MNFDAITYQDLVKRYGAIGAFDMLLTVERLAKIKESLETSDEETRFQQALDALNAIDFAA